jgi:(p)ppGpp synthase/HD superfamily hydrolase
MSLSSRMSDAFAFAADLHHSQTRKGTAVPYLSHLMAVAALVLEHGGNEDEAIAALLHDALEDQSDHFPGGITALRQEIDRRFGPTVTAIVEACTDACSHPKPPWRPRKEAYIAHLATAPVSVLRVSAADKLHNARCILSDYRILGDGLWDRFNADRDQILWYYRALIEVFQDRPAPPGLLIELERTVAELEHLVQLGVAHSGGQGV